MRRLSFLVFIACSGNAQQATDNLYDGVTTTDPSLDAVGAIAYVGDDANHTFYSPLCTGTLISPTTVLAAAHCGIGYVGINDMYFIPGNEPNAVNPTVKYKMVTGVQVAGAHTGGLIGIGNDIFAFHLDEPITDIKPIAIGRPMVASDIGQRFDALGYGIQNNEQANTGTFVGQRTMGPMTLNSLGTRFPGQLFATYEDFRKNEGETFTDLNTCDADCEAGLVSLWNNQLLSTEAFLGLHPGEANACSGDSGGPLLSTVTKSDGTTERQIFGVVSWGWHTAAKICYGSIYATLDDQAVAFLAEEKNWVDPCGDLTTEGFCQGTVATRCTGLGEGDRRVSTVDCSDQGQTCTTASGKADCTGAVPTAPTGVATPQDVLDAIQTPFGSAAINLLRAK